MSAAAELARWKGQGLQPQEGCGLYRAHLGAAEVLVEYEHTPASGDGWNEPHEPESFNVLGVFINGVMCDAQDVAPHKLDDWAAEIAQHVKEQREAEADDYADAHRAFDNLREAFL